MQTSERSEKTFLEALMNSLRKSARYHTGDMVAPASILWTDSDGQWESLLEHLQPLMPELFTLGEYNPDEKTGPAIWLRCVIERSLPDIELPEDVRQDSGVRPTQLTK